MLTSVVVVVCNAVGGCTGRWPGVCVRGVGMLLVCGLAGRRAHGRSLRHCTAGQCSYVPLGRHLVKCSWSLNSCSHDISVLVLASESQREGNNVPSVRNLVVNKERMTPGHKAQRFASWKNGDRKPTVNLPTQLYLENVRKKALKASWGPIY